MVKFSESIPRNHIFIVQLPSSKIFIEPSQFKYWHYLFSKIKNYNKTFYSFIFLDIATIVGFYAVSIPFFDKSHPLLTGVDPSLRLSVS